MLYNTKHASRPTQEDDQFDSTEPVEAAFAPIQTEETEAIDAIHIGSTQQKRSTGIAPWLTIPNASVTNIEHPCIIKNVDNGIKSLGGPRLITKFLNYEHSHEVPKTIAASLRPNDPVAKPVMSHGIVTKDVLLRISVPKRTGRRRKKGTNGPWEGEAEFPTGDGASASGPKTADPNYLIRSIRDNPAAMKMEPIGIIDETHRFRSMPDFQYAASGDQLVTNLRDLVMPMDWNNFQSFKLSGENLRLGTSIGPPPAVEPNNVPFNWSYRQNANLKFMKPNNPDERPAVFNTQKAEKPIMHKVAPGAPSVPDSSPVPLAAEETLEPLLQKAIALIRAELDERPIISRRVIYNKMPGDVEYVLRYAWAYCGFFFTSGPWKDMLCKFGIDPRTDPQCRFCQVMKFKLVPNVKKAVVKDAKDEGWQDQRVKWARSHKGQFRNPEGHIFDGKNLYADGKVWQVIDITDPLISSLLNTSTLRDTCDINDQGWFCNGTIAKVQIIMRDKIQRIQAGEPIEDGLYERIVKFPDNVTDDNLGECFVSTPKKKGDHRPPKMDKENLMANEVRKLAVETLNRMKRTLKLAKDGANGKGKGAEQGTESLGDEQAAGGADGDSADEDAEGEDIDAEGEDVDAEGEEVDEDEM